MDDTCSYCGEATPAMVLAANFGRCRRCFWKVGLADQPPSPDVASDMSKIPCKRCGSLILPRTAWRTLGYCMSCLPQKDCPLPVDPTEAKARFSRIVEPTAIVRETRFYSRYLSGEREAVWEEMRATGGDIGKGSVWEDACNTVQQTMERVRYNVETIVDRLRTMGYQFADPDAAHAPPTERSLRILDQLEHEFGSFPLSLRLFYEVVGSVNLCQSAEQLEQGVFDEKARSKIPALRLMGEEAPLYVASPKMMMRQASWASQTHDGRRYLWIAPDECGRAHYSNGDDCHVLMPEPGVDFRWVEMREESIPPETRFWFVDLLRQVFRGGGFQGRSDPDNDWQRRPPRNALTRSLFEGLLPI
jgi:hypothetical protein